MEAWVTGLIKAGDYSPTTAQRVAFDPQGHLQSHETEDAFKFAYDMKPSPISAAGVQAFYDAELYQWNGMLWTKIP